LREPTELRAPLGRQMSRLGRLVRGRREPVFPGIRERSHRRARRDLVEAVAVRFHEGIVDQPLARSATAIVRSLALARPPNQWSSSGDAGESSGSSG